MFGEDVKQEETSEFFGGDLALGRDKDTLLREAVNDNQDRSVTVGLRELFDEVHQDGIPVSGGDRQGLKPTVGFVPSGLVSGTCDARLNVRPYQRAKVRPVILAGNDLEGLVLSGMACEWVVVFVA